MNEEIDEGNAGKKNLKRSGLVLSWTVRPSHSSLPPVIADNLIVPARERGQTVPNGVCVAAMSGGVDSAVACLLAVEQGFDTIGLTMRLWSPGNGHLSERVRQCCGPTAYNDARAAAATAGIPHYIVNFETAFSKAVVDYFCGEYLAGRTPNPCVACNNLIKFGALQDFAKALGAVTLITGHYARVYNDAAGPHLLRALDRTKDQSYMLAGLRPEQLAHLVLPLGAYTKEQTRALAEQFCLDVAAKPDSMDLCFVDGDYRSFIVQRYPDSVQPGPIVKIDGDSVGEHDGLLGYTVGQRKGLPAHLHDGPWYVVRTDRNANAVVIGRREDLERRTVRCSAINVIRAERFYADGAAEGLAVCRYRSKAVPARAVVQPDGALHVEFAQTVPVVTPGQLMVLYDEIGEEVIASGIIEP